MYKVFADDARNPYCSNLLYKVFADDVYRVYCIAIAIYRNDIELAMNSKEHWNYIQYMKCNS